MFNLKRLFKTKTGILYSNIKEISIVDFWAIQEGHIDYIIKSGNLEDFSEKELTKAYYNLMDDYYEYFNREDETINRMRKEYEYALILADYIKTQDPISRMELELLQVEIEEDKKLENDKYKPRKKQDLSEFITYLEYMYSFQMSEDMTAYTFYSRLKNIRNNINNKKEDKQ